MSLICLNGTEYPLLPAKALNNSGPGTWFYYNAGSPRAYLITFEDRTWRVHFGPPEQPLGHYGPADKNYPFERLDFEPRTLDGTDLLRRD